VTLFFILAIGKHDIYPDHLSLLDKNITIIAASSDHMVVDVTDSTTSFVLYNGCIVI